ncbi:MAG TPA: hypothetical protein VN800_05380 [Candidatus Acidoferrales bacterium]|nr:hypothetical protein [Candidatus Acidoferrales bacterium]
MTYWTDQAKSIRAGERTHPLAKIHVALGLVALISIVALIIQGGHLV